MVNGVFLIGNKISFSCKLIILVTNLNLYKPNLGDMEKKSGLQDYQSERNERTSVNKPGREEREAGDKINSIIFLSVNTGDTQIFSPLLRA